MGHRGEVRSQRAPEADHISTIVKDLDPFLLRTIATNNTSPGVAGGDFCSFVKCLSQSFFFKLGKANLV